MLVHLKEFGLVGDEFGGKNVPAALCSSSNFLPK